jgi:hypothetical protein
MHYEKYALPDVAWRYNSGSMLGASFWCSRASTKTNDARLVIPTIAHALASASPSIKARVVEAIEEDDTLPESRINSTNSFVTLSKLPLVQTSRHIKLLSSMHHSLEPLSRPRSESRDFWICFSALHPTRSNGIEAEGWQRKTPPPLPGTRHHIRCNPE